MRRLAVLLLLAAGPASAQGDAGDTETDAGLAPTSVHARLAGTTVELTARFAFDVDGPTFDVGAHPVTLPPTAVVTSAVATVNGSSHRLALDDAEHIDSVFSAFAQDVGAGKRTWAVRIMKNTSGIDIDLAAAARGHVVVELSVEIPGCFYRDARYAELPASWYSHLDAIRDRVKHDDDLDGTCNVSSDVSNEVFPTEWVRFPVRELATRPFGEARIGAAAGRLGLGEDHVARVEIDLSSKLTQVPADLHTAIVIDSSRSMSADEIETQRAIVASYLQHTPPQSRVQVIAYSRHARPLLASWMPAATTAPRIDREIRALAPRNGSNVDEAIAEAGAWLARAKGTRRLIVIDDGRFAYRISELSAAELAHLLPDHTLVHVVDVSFGRAGLVRMDDLTFGELAASTGGIAVGAGMPDDHRLDATMLVHPLGIDRIKVTGPGWHDIEEVGTCPIDRMEDDLLAEGSSCTWWGRGDAVSGPITFEGFLWGQRITRVLRADPSQARHLARELTTSDSISDDDLKKRIDRAAFAINNAWSMLATWGGTGGYADLEGSDTFGFGRFGSSSHDGVGDTIGMLSGHVKLDLKKQLAPAVAACHATRSKVTIELETTLQEIVDVTVAVKPDDEAIQRCIVEAIWDLSLSIPNAPATASSITVFDP